MPAFESHKFGRARRVDQNLGGFVFSLFEAHLHGALAFAITVNGELDLVLVLVPKRLPEKGNVLALVEEDGARRLFVLLEPLAPSRQGRCPGNSAPPQPKREGPLYDRSS